MSDLEPHPLAELFPMLPDREVAELADDIVTFGQRVPIILLDGKVLDGRNRLAACRFAQVEPVFREYDGDDPLNFVLSHNLHRRHLTESQRALIAAKIVDWETGVNQHTAGAAHVPTHEAARKLSISERAVRAARRIHEHGAAELVEAIRDGRISVRAGEALSELEHAAQLDVLRREEKEIVARAKDIRQKRQKLRHDVRLAHMEMVAAKGAATAPRRLGRAYPVYYADPPWKFGVRSEVTGREKSAENHYPTMTTDEIVALMVELIGGETPGVFYCWATNPMLLDALRVMEACGFTYVHHWIWDKDVAGTGYWGRDRHELLLIGRRGDVAAPLPGSQPDTVYRERKGKHSAKPDFFAETIERLFPGVARLELFSRRARPGWDAWGFEAGGEQSEMAEAPVALSKAEKAGEIAKQSGSPAERPADADPKLVETVVKGLQTETGRKALVAALDVMIAAEDAPKPKRGGRKVVPAGDPGGTAPLSVLSDISPARGETGRPKRRAKGPGLVPAEMVAALDQAEKDLDKLARQMGRKRRKAVAG